MCLCGCNYLVLHLHVVHLQAKALISHIILTDTDQPVTGSSWRLSSTETCCRGVVVRFHLEWWCSWDCEGAWADCRGLSRLSRGFALRLSLVSHQRLTHWEWASRTNVVLWCAPTGPGSVRKVKWEQALLFSSVTVSRYGGFQTQGKGKRWLF